jgi:hypothetical protein
MIRVSRLRKAKGFSIPNSRIRIYLKPVIIIVIIRRYPKKKERNK